MNERRSPQCSYSFEVSDASGAKNAVVTDLGRAVRQDVLKEAMDELGGWELDAASFLGLVIAVTESNDAVVE